MPWHEPLTRLLCSFTPVVVVLLLPSPPVALFCAASLWWQDVRVSYEGVTALRASGRLPFGQVPLLEVVDDGGKA